MNSKVSLNKNIIILFIFNVMVLLLSICFNKIFTYLEYPSYFIRMVQIINCIVLIIGIIFNVVFLKKAKKYDDKKYTIIIIVSFVLYLIFNILGPIIANNIENKKYKPMNQKLISYCKENACEKYIIRNRNNYSTFYIKNAYYDYNKNKYSYTINLKYDDKDISNIVIEILSDNDSYSSELIKQTLSKYTRPFNVDIDTNKIDEAFENRFSSTKCNDKICYEVKEIYEDKALVALRTKIKIELM